MGKRPAGAFFIGAVLGVVLAAVFSASLGCATDDEAGAPAPDAASAPTYHRDVAPILAAHCADCHMGQTVAPRVHLESHEGAAAVAGLLEQVLPRRAMPPWGMDAAGACGSWQRARWLSDAELATLSAWVAAGAPAGDPADEPPPPDTSAPALRRDVLLAPPAPYTPGLGAAAVRCFPVDPALERDRLVTGLEVLPDSAWSVEQVTLFALDSDEAAAAAASLDAADAAPGYACLAGARTPAEHLVTGSSWVDHEGGAWVSRLPAGTGLRLPAGRPLVLQVHYNLVAGALPRDVSVALELDDAVAEAELVEVAAPGFVLAPGLPTTAAAGVVPLPGAMTVHAVYPRMRFLGHTLTLDLVTGPRTGCLAEMRHWDLHGLQKLFVYQEPIPLAAGTTARVTCSYTTLGRTAPLLAGDGDADEECRALLLVTRP